MMIKLAKKKTKKLRLAPIVEYFHCCLSQSITADGPCIQEKSRYNDHRRRKHKPKIIYPYMKWMKDATKLDNHRNLIWNVYVCTHWNENCVEIFLAKDRPQIPKCDSNATVDVLMHGPRKLTKRNQKKGKKKRNCENEQKTTESKQKSDSSSSNENRIAVVQTTKFNPRIEN